MARDFDRQVAELRVRAQDSGSLYAARHACDGAYGASPPHGFGH